jgi:hypothetical protein
MKDPITMTMGFLNSLLQQTGGESRLRGASASHIAGGS